MSTTPALSITFEVKINDSISQGVFKRHLAPLTVGALLRALPFESNLGRIGKNIIYVKSSTTSGIERGRTEFSATDVAFLPSHNSLCFFTGKVQTDMPMTPVGKITENLEGITDSRPGMKISIYLTSL